MLQNRAVAWFFNHPRALEHKTKSASFAVHMVVDSEVIKATWCLTITAPSFNCLIHLGSIHVYFKCRQCRFLLHIVRTCKFVVDTFKIVIYGRFWTFPWEMLSFRECVYTIKGSSRWWQMQEYLLTPSSSHASSRGTQMVLLQAAWWYRPMGLVKNRRPQPPSAHWLPILGFNSSRHLPIV